MENKKYFPFIEITRQQKWGVQYGVNVACPLCAEQRFIGRSIYKEKFKKGIKCKICNSNMVPIFVCKKCKAHLTAVIEGNEIAIKIVSRQQC